MDLRRRAIKSAGWYATTRMVTQTLSWVVTILIARWLSPSDYGLFAMALTLVAAAEMFQELGLGSAIVQRHELSAEQVNGLFWVACASGLLLSGLLWVAADWGGRFYDEPRLAPIVRVITVALFIHALGTVPQSLLTREIDFRRRSLSDTWGGAAAAGVAIVMAYLGFGVWALVWSYLATAGVRTTVLWVQTRWMPRMALPRTGLVSLLRFGLNVTGASAIRSLWVVGNRVIIGRVLGGGALGFYTMADALSTGAHRLSSSVIQQLSLPVFSRLQHHDEQLRRYFLRISKYVGMAVLPVQAGMALVAHDLIPAVLPEQWRPMLGLFQILAVTQAFMVLSLPAGALLVARGHPGRLMRYNVLFATVMLGAVLAGTRFGLAGVGVAWLLAFPPLRLLLIWLGTRELDVPVWDYVRNLAAPLLATALMALVVSSVRLLEGLQASALDRLLASIATGGVIYLVTLLALDRPLGTEIRGIVREFLARPAE